MAAAARIAGAEARQNRAELARWAASAVVVLAVYAAALALVMTWRSPEPPLPAPPPSAMMIDLAPLRPPAPPAVAPSPPPPPPPVEAKAPAVALPPPPQSAPRRPAPPVAAPPPAAAAPPQPAPVPVAPPAPTPANVLLPFETRLVAHLERYKRYPREAQALRQQGVVRLRFTMDRSGKVLAARIDKSSGYKALDDEVLAMIERAAPRPVFPLEIKETQLELLLPIAFSLR